MRWPSALLVDVPVFLLLWLGGVPLPPHLRVEV